jgi:hypothetical protein
LNRLSDCALWSQFRFGAGGFDMKVLELQPAKRVLWQVVDGPRNGSAQK